MTTIVHAHAKRMRYCGAGFKPEDRTMAKAKTATRMAGAGKKASSSAGKKKASTGDEGAAEGLEQA